MALCRPRVLHSSLAPWVHIRRGACTRPDTRRPIVGSTPGAARAVSRRQQERIPGQEYHSMVSRVWPQTGGGSSPHSRPKGHVTVLQCLTCCHVTLTWLGSPAPPTAATPTATSASTHPAHSRAASTLPHGTTPAFVHPACCAHTAAPHHTHKCFMHWPTNSTMHHTAQRPHPSHLPVTLRDFAAASTAVGTAVPALKRSMDSAAPPDLSHVATGSEGLDM